MISPKWILLAACLVSSLWLPAESQARSFGLLELRDAIEGNKPERLRELLDSDIPADASRGTLDLYYGAKSSAALSLGELAALESVLRQWMKDGTPDGARGAVISLIDVLWLGTGVRLEEAIGLTQSLIDQASLANQKVFLRAKLANILLDVGEFAAAEKWLKEADVLVQTELPAFGTRGERAYWAPDARALLARVRCIQNQRRFQFTEAIKSCQASLALLAEANKNVRLAGPVAQRGSRVKLTQTLYAMTEVQIGAHDYAAAEETLARLAELNRDAPPGSVEGLYLLKIRGTLALEKNDLRMIQTVFSGQEAMGKATHADPRSSIYLAAGQQRLAADMLFGRWALAKTRLEQMDQTFDSQDPGFRRLLSNPVARALVHIKAGSPAAVVDILKAELDNFEQSLGAEHPYTNLLRGLRSVALIRSDPARSSSAREELKLAVRHLLAKGSALDDYFNRIDHPIAKRIIFEQFVDLTAQAAAQGDQDYVAVALGLAEALRNSAVQAAMNDAAVRASASSPELADLVRRDQDARNEILALNSFISDRATLVAQSRLDGVLGEMRERLKVLEKTRQGLSAELSRRFPDYFRLTQPGVSHPLQVAEKLGPDEALVVLLPTEEQVQVWAIRSNYAANPAAGMRFHSAPIPRAALAARVQKLRASLDVAGERPERMPPFDHENAWGLYRDLLLPLADFLSGSQEVVIAAAGPLSRIPFGVLQTGPSPASQALHGDLAGARWWIRDKAITHIPSMPAWLAMRAAARPRADKALMAWGDPQFAQQSASLPAQPGAVRRLFATRATAEGSDRAAAFKYGDIPALPETRDELMAIAGAVGADPKADLVLGAQATRASVLAQSRSGELGRRRLVAFATHGLMSSELPGLTQPALALAADASQSGSLLAPLLLLEDVLTLKLNADWVLLSACNTAAADGKAEEALSGLARGFFYAGSRSLLVTHWAVASDSAVMLTTEIFKHYQQEAKASKAQSLRHAMLTVMKNPSTVHPSDWAPYALVGDGQR